MKWFQIEWTASPSFVPCGDGLGGSCSCCALSVFMYEAVEHSTFRATDPTLFEGIVIDMFEAFREMELNTLAQLVDAQLTDPEFAKRSVSVECFIITRDLVFFCRWTPLNRNPLTDHSNPVLEISCRLVACLICLGIIMLLSCAF